MQNNLIVDYNYYRNIDYYTNNILDDNSFAER